MARGWSRFAVAALALQASGAGASLPAKDTTIFNWDDIEPSSKLEYHDCYTPFKCARLLVPLDWLDEGNPNRVALAIIKLPASVPDTDPSYGGPVLLNPGGPGGSGVNINIGWGPRLQKILDGEKHYEMIGFDPRGVMFTTPRANCYPDLLTRATENFQAHGIGDLRSENPRLPWRHALSNAYGQRCEDTLGDEGGILGYASTASVARDMVAIIDKIQELHEEEKAKTAANKRGSEQERLGDDASKTKEPARLQYIGFSYGTLLGNTFASMFPGRVGRIIIDGVAHIDDYMAGTWLKNLLDTDELMDALYQRCFDLGKRCALVHSDDKSWEDIKTKVDEALNHLAKFPVTVKTTGGTLLVSKTDISSLVFTSLYKPNVLFPLTAGVLDIVVRRDYQKLAEVIGALYPALQTYCPLCVNPDYVPVISLDAQPAISCEDGEDSSQLSLDDWSDYFEQLNNQSSVNAPIWAGIRFRCSGWRNRPKYRFMGPFETPEADPSIAEGKPAAPLLLLTSRLDPVTPLRNAFAMAERHPGSSVVVQESLGHCALGSGVSQCTEKIVREYFETGKVPKSGTVCEEDYAALSADVATMARDTAPVVPLGMPNAKGFAAEDLMEKLINLSMAWSQGGEEASEAEQTWEENVEVGEL